MQAVVYIYPMMILFLACKGMSLVLNHVFEEDEAQIKWMLSLLGMQQVTDLVFKITITCAISLPMVVSVALFSSLVCFPSIGPLTNLLAAIIFVSNLNAILLLLTYCLSPKIR